MRPRVVLMAAGFMALAQTALADDQPFISLYTSDIVSAQEHEIEQRILFTAQRPGEAYAGIESNTAFEYGVSDDFQISGYANFAWERARPHAPLSHAGTESEFGVSGEAIYRFLNVYFDPVGLAVYLEPSYSQNERGLEGKLLLQKNFFNDDLRLAFNANFENRWEREAGAWRRGSAIEMRLGAAYNLTPEWSLCGEFSSENEYDGLVGGGHPLESLYYVGPTISYKGLPLTVSFGAQAQLPWARDHTNTPGAIRDGFAVDAERWRVGLVISRDVQL